VKGGATMRFLETVDDFCKNADWKDFALLKLCMAAIGFLIGLSVREEKKRPWLIVSLAVFLATYIPLMMKFVPVLFAPVRECGMYAGANEGLEDE
jgi:hypothetical protein